MAVVRLKCWFVLLLKRSLINILYPMCCNKLSLMFTDSLSSIALSSWRTIFALISFSKCSFLALPMSLLYSKNRAFFVDVQSIRCALWSSWIFVQQQENGSHFAVSECVSSLPNSRRSLFRQADGHIAKGSQNWISWKGFLLASFKRKYCNDKRGRSRTNCFRFRRVGKIRRIS